VAPTDRAPEPSLYARAWIDFSAAGGADIFLSDRSGTRFAARRVAFRALDEIATETVTQILQSALAALLDPQAPALTRREVAAELQARGRPPLERPFSPHASSSHGYVWEAQLGFGVRSLSSELNSVSGPALVATLATSEWPWRLLAWIDAEGG